MGGVELIFGIVPVVVIVIFVISTSPRILREYARAVIVRLGRRTSAVFNPGRDGSAPGLLLLIPFIDRMVRVSLRLIGSSESFMFIRRPTRRALLLRASRDVVWHGYFPLVRLPGGSA